MEYGDRPDIISNENWDFAFYGNEIDDRCKDAIEYSKTNSFCQILAIYHPETYQLVFEFSFSLLFSSFRGGTPRLVSLSLKVLQVYPSLTLIWEAFCVSLI